MELKSYYRKKIKLIDTIGKTYHGTVGDYVFPDDNENGKESIILDVESGVGPIEFYENEIVSIELID